MMFKIPFLISHISSIMTLLEGDVILTGTICICVKVLVEHVFEKLNNKKNTGLAHQFIYSVYALQALLLITTKCFFWQKSCFWPFKNFNVLDSQNRRL